MSDSPTLFEEFCSFVLSRPPEEKFDPWDGQYCAVARFGKQKFPDEFKEAGFHSIILNGYVKVPIVEAAPQTFFLMDAIIHSRTMGQLAKKLEKLS